MPHTYPFLLIDRVLAIESGKSIHAYKNITYNESFLQGHFKDEPVVPGVMIIESLAQSGAFNLLVAEENRGKNVFLAGLDKFKFSNVVEVGDRLELHVEIIKRMGNIGRAKAWAEVEGKGEIAVGEMTFCLVDKNI